MALCVARVAILALALASMLPAQQPVCPPAVATADSLTVILNLAARPAFVVGRSGDRYATRVAQAVAKVFVPPRPVAMTTYVGHRVGGDDASRVSGAHADAQTTVEVMLRRDGHVAAAEIMATSLVEALDRSLLAAISTADREGMLPRPPSDVASDSIRLRFRLATSDSGRVTGTPIERLHVPLRHYDRAVAVLPDQPAPPYPGDLRAKGVEGRVDVSFIVDETGGVMARTISVRGASAPAFADAVLRVLPEYRFDAAVVDGCAVRFRAAMPFEFSIDR